MIAELEVLRDAIGRLESAGISYMLTGSIALGYYARPRMTRDIDLVVELKHRDATQVAAIFSQQYYVSEDDVSRAMQQQGMFNILHLQQLVKIDLIVCKDTDYRRHEFARRRKVSFADLEVWIVSKEDLVLSKLIWAKPSMSELQLRDVSDLIASGVDENYLSRWAPVLGVDSLLERCRNAGHHP